MFGSDWEAVLSSRYGAENIEWASRATAPTPKFSEYIFRPGATHGKDAVFRSLGYTIDDSRALARSWEIQASEQFTRGNYSLGKLDAYGQRIDIEIRLPGVGAAAGQESFLRSGWMIQPDGHITLNTPFTGFTR